MSIYVPGHESHCLTPTEVMDVYEKIEQNELIAPFKFFQEQSHPHLKTNLNFDRDYHIHLAYTFCGTPPMPLTLTRTK